MSVRRFRPLRIYNIQKHGEIATPAWHGTGKALKQKEKKVPIYEYACSSCGHRYERYEAGRHAGREKREGCPKCGSEKAEKVFSTFASGSCGGTGSVVGGGSSGGGCGHGGFS
jgi:putative FmdB family regulatory protein